MRPRAAQAIASTVKGAAGASCLQRSFSASRWACVEPGRICARGANAERKRLPPIVETRVLHPDGQFGVVDVVEAGGLEQLGEVTLAGPRKLRFVLSAGIKLSGRRPEQAERTSPTGVVPDASGDDSRQDG